MSFDSKSTLIDDPIHQYRCISPIVTRNAVHIINDIDYAGGIEQTVIADHV